MHSILGAKKIFIKSPFIYNWSNNDSNRLRTFKKDGKWSNFICKTYKKDETKLKKSLYWAGFEPTIHSVRDIRYNRSATKPSYSKMVSNAIYESEVSFDPSSTLFFSNFRVIVGVLTMLIFFTNEWTITMHWNRGGQRRTTRDSTFTTELLYRTRVVIILSMEYCSSYCCLLLPSEGHVP